MNTLNKIKNKEEFIIIVPARSGSKRVVNKNLRMCGGKKLIFWTLNIIKLSIGLKNCYVSTDSYQILKYSKNFGVENFIFRAKSVSQDKTSMLSTLKDTLNKISKKEIINKKYLILLQPTSPLRIKSDIVNSILKFNRLKPDSLVSSYSLDNLILDSFSLFRTQLAR